MRENAGQNNSEYEHFSRSGNIIFSKYAQEIHVKYLNQTNFLSV